MQISLNNYKKLLSQIQKIIGQTEQRIVADVNHEKVLMAWEIGKIIEEHLLKNNRADYGVQFFNQLEKDILVARITLYQMRNFYKTYPVLPAKEKGLNWSHYRNLLVVKSDERRKYLEDLVVEKKLGSNELQRKISAEKKVKRKKLKPKSQKLKFTRGVLFTYKLAELRGSEKTFVDCGFNIFTEAPSLPRGWTRGWTGFVTPSTGSVQSKKGGNAEGNAEGTEREDGVTNPVLQQGVVLQHLVESVKTGEKISLRKSKLNSDQLHTYKAYLDRVVDGDTLHVTLDLGFKIRHKEILRLAKINSPEADTFEGKKSSDALTKILAEVPFLIVKTNKTDIYGRYIADVFLAEKNETDAGKVAAEGVYLNQLLIDSGMADVF